MTHLLRPLEHLLQEAWGKTLYSNDVESQRQKLQELNPGQISKFISLPEVVDDGRYEAYAETHNGFLLLFIFNDNRLEDILVYTHSLAFTSTEED